MKKRSPTVRMIMATVIVLILTAVVLAGSAFSAQKIVLKKYPDLKIGFTTTNFLKFLPVSVESTKKLIDFASDQGFPWIELRDPSATLTLNECQQIAAYAESKKIEVSYALQIGLLDSTFGEIFFRGLANAAVFKGPETIRTLAAGVEFGDNPKKTAWTLKELFRAVKVANFAGNQARAAGLKYVAENAFEAIKGDGLSSYGLTEFFANVNSNVFWQFDTANFFATSRVYTKPEDARAFLEKHAARMPYIHAKTSSKEHKPLPYLEDNELDFDIIFSALAKHKVSYVALELVPGNTVEETYANHKKSVEYLLKNF